MSRQRVPITLTYEKKGTTPPMYVAGSFSDPPWQPLEMDVSINQHGEYRFTKQIMVDDGSEIQYKFRIGFGDWWALDDNADTVTDDLGNTNNILRVSISKPKKANAKAPNPLINKLKGSAASSGTQTPDMAKTAAEVADSARIVYPRTPEPEVSDGEAGRIGFRRLSATPIDQVAQTAMDVATVAATLGDGDSDWSDVNDGNDKDDEDDEDDEEGSENGSCPVFSHEFIGPPRPNEETPDNNGLENKTDTERGDPAIEVEDMDFDNPELEAFPSSDRDSILAAMRRISTSIDADRTVIEGLPPSPIVTIFPPRETISSREEPSAPTSSANKPAGDDRTPRPSLSVHRRGSAHSGTRTTSIGSLGYIAEDDEVLNEKAINGLEGEPITTPFVQHPGPAWGSAFEHTVIKNGDDEGIAMSNESEKSVELSPDCLPFLPAEPTPPSSGNDVDDVEVAAPSSDEPVSTLGETNATASHADVLAAARKEAAKDSPIIAELPMPGTWESNSPNTETMGEGEAQSTSIDRGDQPDLRKRTADKPATPPSIHNSQSRNNYPDWFETCCRVVLVRWIGGFASWLYGRRHRAFLAAGTVVVILGVRWLWQSPIRI
ncbi:hypothetical protein F4819DRAFT_496183 [Hypoxylon fuscum]|nr:hypothetical protein F4819DRAFT_496183 [Hypoxylon fuscum]